MHKRKVKVINMSRKINLVKDLYMKQVAIAAEMENSILKFKNVNYNIDKIYVSPYSSDHFARVSELKNPRNVFNVGLNFDYDKMTFVSNGLMEIPM